MKINKETRQLSKGLLRASFTDGQLDSGRISSLLKSLIEKKPRHYIQVLEAYKRLVRLEVEKRTATIETATELSPETGQPIVDNLKRRYGNDLTARFVVNPELLGESESTGAATGWTAASRNRFRRPSHNLNP